MRTRITRTLAAIAAATLLGACSADTTADTTADTRADTTADPADAPTSDAATDGSDAPSSARDDALAREVVEGYADGVHASYAASLTSAQAMDAAIDAFLAAPTEDTLAAARQAWLTARDDYGPTEAFRFYGGPIDDEEVGVEGLVNAWPLDEAYIDYVDGDAEAGIVNDPEGTPEITVDVLLGMNELGGEANVATGWHAIEFLLWGQDLSEEGPGERPASDYVDAPNADRRGQYLAVASDLLLAHLDGLVAAWDPAADDNYRAEFLALDTDAALANIITGIGELSRGELAGERMSVAYFERSQEDEHSCFSDNTTADIVGNAEGIRRVIVGEYPDVTVPGLIDLVGSVDAGLAAELLAAATDGVADAAAIPAPFDAHLREDVADDDPGRAAVLAAITTLEDQADVIVAGAAALGVDVAVS